MHRVSLGPVAHQVLGSEEAQQLRRHWTLSWEGDQSIRSTLRPEPSDGFGIDGRHVLIGRPSFALKTAAMILVTAASCGAARTDPTPTVAVAPLQDGQRDFDFEIGTWRTHLVRRLHPLTGSTTWVTYDGTTTVRPVWDGAANIVELVVDGAAGHFQGLSLRTYSPQTRQWMLSFANAIDGQVAAPTIGGFVNGRGEFYQQDTLAGRSIFVRFVMSRITASSVHFEQAYSADGGKTWEVNWIADDTRVR